MTDSLSAARERALAARTRLVASVTLLRTRLSPGVLARDIKDSVVAKSVDAARSGADAVIEHKWTVAGAASLVGLFLARGPIVKLLTRDDETGGAPARLTRK